MNLEYPWYMIIPVISVVAGFLIKKTSAINNDLTKIADRHLLKYLLNTSQSQNYYKYLTAFGIIFLLSLALANPRWGERQYKLYSGNAAAVIILDVSTHMGCQDVKPSRMIRARQIAADIVKNFKQVNFGLVAFAKNAHLITPITEDQSTLHNYLPALDYKLVYQEGQELDSSLNLATEMLNQENTHKKSIILLSAGNFNAHNFKTKYPVYVIGVGTEQGAPMHDKADQHVYINAQLQMTKLNLNNLKKLANTSSGQYFSYLEVQRNVQILDKFLTSKQLLAANGTIKTWNDAYPYILMLAAMLIAFSIKRGILVLSIAGLMVFAPESQAANLGDLFKNNEQLAMEAVERLDFTAAAQLFSDPYNQGVSLYKAKEYAQAINAFKNNNREEVKIDALYNLGNSYYMLEHYQEAIDNYEQVLKSDPNHQDAKFNLELARKKLKEKENKKDDKDCGCDDKKPDNKNDKSKSAKDNENSSNESKEPNNNDAKDNADNKDNKEHKDEQEQMANNSKDQQENKPEEARPQDDKQQAADKEQNQDKNADENEQPKLEDLQQDAEVALDEQQQKWLQRINSDISNFLKTRMYIDDLKSNK